MPRHARHVPQPDDPELNLVEVEVGSEPGLYYIPVANLSHSTTWQHLRAFAAQVCEVDYASVYNPTAGFVRVKGYENFRKAFDHLNGGVLHGRAIMAFDGNEKSSIWVKLRPDDYHAKRIAQGKKGRAVLGKT
ncbi:hypothetical protein QBC35DRAFT_447921, partial [Podospora australis]